LQLYGLPVVSAARDLARGGCLLPPRFIARALAKERKKKKKFCFFFGRLSFNKFVSAFFRRNKYPLSRLSE